MKMNIQDPDKIPDNSMPEWNRIVTKSLAKDNIDSANDAGVKKDW